MTSNSHLWLQPGGLYYYDDKPTGTYTIPSDFDPASLQQLAAQPAIAIDFLAVTDGRAFSLARQLRANGYSGRILAQGHLIPDQVVAAFACGFDAVLITAQQSEKHKLQPWLDSIKTPVRNYATSYGTDAARSVWRVRGS